MNKKLVTIKELRNLILSFETTSISTTTSIAYAKSESSSTKTTISPNTSFTTVYNDELILSIYRDVLLVCSILLTFISIMFCFFCYKNRFKILIVFGNFFNNIRTNNQNNVKF